MNLHEYQAKKLFKQFGMPVSPSYVAKTVEEAVAGLSQLEGPAYVVKAQVHAGGRGKAGGVKLVKSAEEVAEVARNLLHKYLVTYQTDSKGQLISELLIEQASDIERELYLGAVLDRATQKIVIMASTEGGVEIEKVAHETPEKIIKVVVDPLIGVMPYQCREVGFKLGLTDVQIKQFSQIMMGLGMLFIECDLALVEINPLIITTQGKIICLDGKINVDENALYRQSQIREMRDITQEDEREVKAKEWELNYISLEGNIGCMVNGAGLAMATMDLIKLHGGNPANFLDVGGGATQERVREAFKIILSDSSVKAVLVNIFGGIVRCDLIAEGIIGAVQEVGITIPVVVRLEGNRAKEASALLAKSGLNITPATGLTDAATKVVALASK